MNIELSEQDAETIGIAMCHELWEVDEAIETLEHMRDEHSDSFNEARSNELNEFTTYRTNLEGLLEKISKKWFENLLAYREFIGNMVVLELDEDSEPAEIGEFLHKFFIDDNTSNKPH